MKKNTKAVRDLSFDAVRDLRMGNTTIEVSKKTASRQGIKPGWYSPRELREVTK